MEQVPTATIAAQLLRSHTWGGEGVDNHASQAHNSHLSDKVMGPGVEHALHPPLTHNSPLGLRPRRADAHRPHAVDDLLR